MDYKDLYPSPPDRDPGWDGGMIPRQPEQPRLDSVAESSVPGNTAQGAFWGDPRFQNTPAPEIPDLTVPEQPPAAMNRRVYAVFAVMAVLVFLLCLYCIISDLMHGALQGTDVKAPSVELVVQMQKAPDLDPEDENVTAEGTYTARGVAEAVRPSIVEVCVYSDAERTVAVGTGSGVVFSENGYIITNAHVLAGEYYSVIDYDENEYEAQVVGSDAKTDLAVIRVDAQLTPAVFGDSDQVYVGQDVMAIGNPAGLKSTVTKGIVSAVNRQIRSDSAGFRMECIQTDAAISPGNSGGALVNMYGQVIGITSSKYASQYEATYEGLGFAITTADALPILEELAGQGFVSGRFRIGIVFIATDSAVGAYQYEQTTGMPLPAGITGLWINEISEDCDIAGTELAVNDFILSVNGTQVHTYDEVMEVLEGFEGGDTVKAGCARVSENGTVEYFDIEFKLEEDTSGNY